MSYSSLSTFSFEWRINCLCPNQVKRKLLVGVYHLQVLCKNIFIHRRTRL